MLFCFPSRYYSLSVGVFSLEGGPPSFTDSTCRATHGLTSLSWPSPTRLPLFGGAFQHLRLRPTSAVSCRTAPVSRTAPVKQRCGLYPRLKQRSLAATWDLAVSLPRKYLDVSVPVTLHTLCVQHGYHPITDGGFTYSEIHGSTPACGSRGISVLTPNPSSALAPRHPPCALSLT